MAHLIGKHDRQQGRRMAWHGLTDIRENLTLEECHLNENAPDGNGWDVVPAVLYTDKGLPVIADMDMDEEGNVIKTYPYSILRCTDKPDLTVGTPYNPKTYIPITNAEFLDVIIKSMAGTGYTVESVLSCKDRARVAVSLAIDGLDNFSVGERHFENYLNFLQGFDQKTVWTVNTSNTCTVCHNTFLSNLFHRGKKVDVRLRHTQNIKLEIKNVPEIIEAAIGVQAQFKAAFESLAAAPVKHSEAKAVFLGHLVRATDEEIKAPDFEISTRSVNRVDRLLELFHDDSKGNIGASRADLFSAVTDYYTHESAGGEDKWKQLESSEFGAGSKAKADFWTMVNSPEDYASTRARGEKLVPLI